MHPSEVQNQIFQGRVKIEDKSVTFGGKPSFKERWAVLCETRLLLFKSQQTEKSQRTQENSGADYALAVYPIISSTFNATTSYGEPVFKLSFNE